MEPEEACLTDYCVNQGEKMQVVSSGDIYLGEAMMKAVFGWAYLQLEASMLVFPMLGEIKNKPCV